MLLNALIVLAGTVVAVAVALLCESARLNREESASLACDIERDAVRTSLRGSVIELDRPLSDTDARRLKMLWLSGARSTR